MAAAPVERRREEVEPPRFAEAVPIPLEREQIRDEVRRGQQNQEQVVAQVMGTTAKAFDEVFNQNANLELRSDWRNSELRRALI
ncbi:hypothetical protein KKB44_00060 [Candidatus Micrarchaeota archaeon]|nr:hypothetical protein [Candidatus Micrarchaeota archaeon]